jgi:hypothetical protein
MSIGAEFGAGDMERMGGQARVPILHEGVDVTVGAGDVDCAAGNDG